MPDSQGFCNYGPRLLRYLMLGSQLRNCSKVVNLKEIIMMALYFATDSRRRRAESQDSTSAKSVRGCLAPHWPHEEGKRSRKIGRDDPLRPGTETRQKQRLTNIRPRPANQDDEQKRLLSVRCHRSTSIRLVTKCDALTVRMSLMPSLFKVVGRRCTQEGTIENDIRMIPESDLL